MQDHSRVFGQCCSRSFKGGAACLFEWSFEKLFEGVVGHPLERPKLVNDGSGEFLNGCTMNDSSVENWQVGHSVGEVDELGELNKTRLGE